MRHTKQVDTYGCVVACGAMLTGKTYEQVKQDLREVLHGGVNDDAVLPYLYHEGFFARKVTRFNLITQDVVEWPPKPFAPVHWCRVLTKLDNTAAHAVLMDNEGIIYDPLLDGPAYNGFADYARVYWVAGLWKADWENANRTNNY
jgi:hypothetical protein